MSWAVEARQELDLRIGCAFSRMQTNYLRNSVPKLHDLKLISYGPCQFPTLGFVVERYNEIKNFLPETFWKIIVKYLRNKIDVNFTWDRNHLFDELSCQVIYESCMDSKEATVIFMDKKPKSKYRPQPLYTVEFEKLATKYLKLTSKQAMTIAEKLYSQGFISYPRTETNMFSSATNLVELIQPQISHPKWGEFARKVLQSGPNPRNGNKTDNAHPPIHPVKYTNELKFKATGLIITDRGYLDVYPFDKWSAQELPEFKLGEKFIPTTLTMDTGETSPPSLLTEADLIALMEKYQIGQYFF
ncbi:hypothetical protein HZS_7052 [Henneguya salminicola]|nr:hypothetical protein HZS_7052 [Henneguya salminicola]